MDTHAHTQSIINQLAHQDIHDAICEGVSYTTQLIPTTTAILTSYTYEVYHTQSTLFYHPMHLCNGDTVVLIITVLIIKVTRAST